MSDKMTSRSDYLKLMYGGYTDKVNQLTSDNMNAVGDSSIESLSTTLDNQAQNSISNAKRVTDDTPAEEKQKDRNWWQKIWDTADSVGLSLAEGMLSWFDDIWDFGVTTADAIAGGGNQWATDLKNYDWQSSVQKGANLLNIMHAFSGDMFTSDYWSEGWGSEDAREMINDTLNNSYLNNMGTGATEFVRGVENSIGYMIPSIVAAWLTGGSSLAAQGAQAMLSNGASLAVMGAGAFAGSTSDYYDENGGNYGRAVLGGVANAAVEVGTEMIFSGGGKVASNVLVRIGKEALEEGVEEVISGALDPIKDWIGGTKDGQGIADSYWGKDAVDFWFKGNDSVLMQGVSGAVTGIVMGAPSNISNLVKYGNSGTVLVEELNNVRESAQALSEAEKGSKEYIKAAKEYGDAVKNFNDALDKVKNDGKLSAKQKESIASLFSATGISEVTSANLSNAIEQLSTEINSDGGEKFLGRMKFSQLTNGLVGNMSLDYGKTTNGNIAEIKNGKVTIDFNKAKGSVANTIVHEVVGHAWANEVVNDVNLSSLVDDIQNSEWYKNNEKELRKAYIEGNKEYLELSKKSLEQAENYWKREVVANYIEEMFSRPKAISKGLFGTTGLKALDKLLGRGIFNKAFKNQNAAKSFINLINEFTKKYANPIYNALIKTANGEKLNAREQSFVDDYKHLFPIYEDYANVVAFAKTVSNKARQSLASKVAKSNEKTNPNRGLQYAKTINGKQYFIGEGGAYLVVNSESNKLNINEADNKYAQIFDATKSFDQRLNGSQTDMSKTDIEAFEDGLDEVFKSDRVTKESDREVKAINKELSAMDSAFVMKMPNGKYIFISKELMRKALILGGVDRYSNITFSYDEKASHYTFKIVNKDTGEYIVITPLKINNSHTFEKVEDTYRTSNGYTFKSDVYNYDGSLISKGNAQEVFDSEIKKLGFGEKTSNNVVSVEENADKSDIEQKEQMDKWLEDGQVNGEPVSVQTYLENPNFYGDRMVKYARDLLKEKMFYDKADIDVIANELATLISNFKESGWSKSGGLGYAASVLEKFFKEKGLKIKAFKAAELILEETRNFKFNQKAYDEYAEKKNAQPKVEQTKTETAKQEEVADTRNVPVPQKQEVVELKPTTNENGSLEFKNLLNEDYILNNENGEMKFDPKKILPEEKAPENKTIERMLPSTEQAQPQVEQMEVDTIGNNENMSINGEEIKLADFDSTELIKRLANERINGTVTNKNVIEQIIKGVEIVIAKNTETNFKIPKKSEIIQTLFKMANLTNQTEVRKAIKKTMNDIFNMDLGDGYTYQQYLRDNGINIKNIRDNWVKSFELLMDKNSKKSKSRVQYENALLTLSKTIIEANNTKAKLSSAISLLKNLNAKINSIKNATKVTASGKTGKYAGLEFVGGQQVTDLLKKIQTRVRANGVDGEVIDFVKDFIKTGSLEKALNGMLLATLDVSTAEFEACNGDLSKQNALLKREADTLDLIHKDEVMELANALVNFKTSFEVNSKRSSTGKETWHRKLTAGETIVLGDFIKAIFHMSNMSAVNTKEIAKKNSEKYRNAVKQTAIMMRGQGKLAQSLKSLQGIGLDFANPKMLVSLMFGGTYKGSVGEEVWRKYFRDPYMEQLAKQVQFETRINEIVEPLDASSVKKIEITDKNGKKIKANRYVLYNYYLNSLAEDNVRRMKANGDTVEFYDGHLNHTIETSVLDDMVNNLTEEEKAQLDRLFLFYNTELKSYSVAVQTKNYGFSSVRDNYYPINVSEASRAVTMTQEYSQTTLSAMSNSRMKMARNVQSKIEINKDPRAIAKAYIEQMTISGEVGKTSKKFAQVLNFKDDGGYSARMYAGEYIDKIKERTTYLQQAIIAKRQDFISSSFYSKIIGKWSTATLGLNVRSALKQFASFFTAWNKTSIMSGLKGMGMAFNKKAINYIKNNNAIFQARIMDHGVIRASTLSNGAAQFTSTAIQKMVEKSLVMMETFDKWTCYMSFGAAQYEAERLHGFKVGTDENLEKANDIFTDMILETQSNSDRIAISRVRSGAKGEITKYLFGMFASDTQNKFTLAMENAWNNKILREQLKVAENRGDTAQATYLKGQLTQSNGMFVKIASTLLAAGLWEFLANMLADWLYDKKDPEDFKIGEALIETAKNSFLDWIPLLGTVTNWIDYGEVNIGATTYLENLIDCFNTVRKSGWSMASFTSVASTIMEAAGLPFGNIKKLIDGVVGNFSPKAAIEMKSIFYGASETYLTKNINDNAKAGKLKKAGAYVSEYYSLYKFGITNDVALEIADIKSSGSSVSTHSRLTEMDDVKLTEQEQRAFDEVYNQTGNALSKAIANSYYSNLNSNEKASVLRKISDAYYNVAKARISGSIPTGRMAKLLNYGVDITKFAVMMARLNGLEGKTQIIQNINKMSGLTRREKLIIAWLMGYSIDQSAFAGLGLKPSQIEAILS